MVSLSPTTVLVAGTFYPIRAKFWVYPGDVEVYVKANISVPCQITLPVDVNQIYQGMEGVQGTIPNVTITLEGEPVVRSIQVSSPLNAARRAWRYDPAQDGYVLSAQLRNAPKQEPPDALVELLKRVVIAVVAAAYGCTHSEVALSLNSVSLNQFESAE